jgi:hypothetical protein
MQDNDRVGYAQEAAERAAYYQRQQQAELAPQLAQSAPQLAEFERQLQEHRDRWLLTPKSTATKQKMEIGSRAAADQSPQPALKACSKEEMKDKQKAINMQLKTVVECSNKTNVIHKHELKEFMITVMNTMQDPRGKENAIKQLVLDAEKMRNQLESEKQKKKDAKKAESIQQHINELEELATQMRKLLEQNDVNKAHAILDLIADNRAAAHQVEMFLTSDADPRTKKLIVDAMTNADIIELIKKTNYADQTAVAQNVVKACGEDAQRLDGLSQDALVDYTRTAGSDPNPYLRDNSVATKLTTQYNKNTDGGKRFLNGALGNCLGTLQNQAANLTSDQHKDLMRQTIDDITNQQVPPEVSKLCATIYNQFKAKYQGQYPNDKGETLEQEALIKVGGHICLRLLCPILIEDELKKYADDDPRRKALLTQGKVLQLLSNLKPSGDSKGEGLEPFNELIGDKQNPGPEAQQLQEFFARVVREGQEALENQG